MNQKELGLLLINIGTELITDSETRYETNIDWGYVTNDDTTSWLQIKAEIIDGGPEYSNPLICQKLVRIIRRVQYGNSRCEVKN